MVVIVVVVVVVVPVPVVAVVVVVVDVVVVVVVVAASAARLVHKLTHVQRLYLTAPTDPARTPPCRWTATWQLSTVTSLRRAPGVRPPADEVC